MKSSTVYTLVTVAAFFVMCPSVMAAGPNGAPGFANEPSDFSDPVSKPSIIQSACLKCHGGKSVNGDLDFTQGLTREQKLAAITKAARGEMPKNGPKLTPPQLSQLKKELGLVNNAGESSAPNEASPIAQATTSAAKARASALKAAASRAAAQKAAATAAASQESAAASQKAAAAAVAKLKQAQARVSVVSSTSSDSSPSSSSADASSIPTARVRVVLPGSPKPKTVTPARGVVVTADDPTKTAVAPPKPVVKPQPVATTPPSGTDNTSKIPDAVKGLVGDWMAVSRQGDGELSTIELQLDDHGWAKLTVPSADGKSSTSTHKVELQKDELKLNGSNSTPDISLGKLVSVDSHQMVLERSSGLVTFVRP